MADIITLFENQGSNGNSSVYEEAQGGFRILKLTGNFDSATVAAEMDFQDDDYANMQNFQFTAPDAVEMRFLKPGIRLRLVLSSAGASTSVTAKLI